MSGGDSVSQFLAEASIDEDIINILRMKNDKGFRDLVLERSQKGNKSLLQFLKDT